jgi:hypothetical protein
MKKAVYIAGFAFLVLLLVAVGWACADKEKQIKSFFHKSLHYTGEGMRYWYEEPNGLKSITGIPYEKLSCKECHAKSCDQCHTKKEGEKCSYSLEKAKNTNTCLACHARAKAVFEAGRKEGTLDVHAAAGMTCADCHKGVDVHGDGIFRHSMRDEGAVTASCTNCHKPKEDEIRPHKVHRGKLDCLSCHVSNSMTCLNCHIDSFAATGKKEGNFLPPVQDWLLLINYKGKITSGTVQTAVYKDKKFIAYAPYFTHSIQAKAKGCRDCHGNAAMELLKKKQPIPMAEFKDGKMVSFKGVVPLVPHKLEWDFLKKDGDKWVPVKGDEPAKVQFVGYGEPLTKIQVKKMAIPFKK